MSKEPFNNLKHSRVSMSSNKSRIHNFCFQRLIWPECNLLWNSLTSTWTFKWYLRLFNCWKRQVCMKNVLMDWFKGITRKKLLNLLTRSYKRKEKPHGFCACLETFIIMIQNITKKPGPWAIKNMEGPCDLSDGYTSTKTISRMLPNVSVKQLKLITTIPTPGLL